MRLPLPTQLKTRVGDNTKDARLKNSYTEIRGQNGEVRKRPGNTDLGLIDAGAAQLLTCWNGLLSVINNSLSSMIITDTGNYPVGFGDFADDGLWFYVPMGDIRIYDHRDNGFVGRFNTLTYEFAYADSVDYPAATYRITVEEPGAGLRIIYTEADDFATWKAMVVGASTETIEDVTIDFDTYTTINAFLGGAYLSGTYFLYFLADDGGGEVPIYFTSADGLTYALQGLTDFTISRPMILPFNSGLIAYDLSVGGGIPYPVYSSTDGASWVYEGDSDTSDAYVPLCVYNDEIFTAFSAGVIYRSTDGLTFTEYGNFPNAILSPVATWSNATGVKSAPASDYGVYDLTNPNGVEQVVATPIGTIEAASLALISESTGATQSTQQLLIKSSEQAWIYTR